MRRERFFSFGRKALIVLLLLTAALLLMQTDYFSVTWRRLNAAREPAGASPASASAAAGAAEAAATLRPRAVMVRFPGGGAFAEAYSGEETPAALRRFSAFWGEALGSAGIPESIGAAEFRSGIEAGCVLLDLGAPVPLGLLSEWVGAGGGGAAAMTASLLYLGLTDDTAVLCFRDVTGGLYRCATATQSETMAARMQEFQGAGAYLAYENPALRRLDPYAVIVDALRPKYACAAQSGRDWADPEVLMEAVGMNAFVASSYTDADGTLVLMEEGKTLRLTPDGLLTFRGSGPDGPGSFNAAVNAAARLALRAMGRTAGAASVAFAGAEAGDRGVTVRFDYALDGVPVALPSGHAAEILVSGGAARSASIQLRHYTATDTQEPLLPMALSASIAAGSGGTPVLSYLDTGEQARCAWVNSSAVSGGGKAG